MSVLDPLSDLLAAVVAGAHDGLTALGLAPDAGLTWCLSIAAVVVIVRGALLPITVHTVRAAHAAAYARPQLRELSQKYRGRTDREAVAAQMQERREIAAEHGLSRLGCLPLLLQLPVWLGLYHLLATVAGGTAVGALDPGLVASLGAATLVGVPLAGRGYLGGGPAHLAVVAGLAATAAVLTYATQRFLVAPAEGLPETVGRVQQLMPGISAAGLLVAGGAVPVLLLASWVLNALWTLAQTTLLRRRHPLT